jgi:hypothetical protein
MPIVPKNLYSQHLGHNRNACTKTGNDYFPLWVLQVVGSNPAAPTMHLYSVNYISLTGQTGLGVGSWSRTKSTRADLGSSCNLRAGQGTSTGWLASITPLSPGLAFSKATRPFATLV